MHLHKEQLHNSCPSRTFTCYWMNWTYDDLLLFKLQGHVLHFGANSLQDVIPVGFIVLAPLETARTYIAFWGEYSVPSGCGPSCVYCTGSFRNCKDVYCILGRIFSPFRLWSKSCLLYWLLQKLQERVLHFGAKIGSLQALVPVVFIVPPLLETAWMWKESVIGYLKA
jgi:hypothetical protein